MKRFLAWCVVGVLAFEGWDAEAYFWVRVQNTSQQTVYGKCGAGTSPSISPGGVGDWIYVSSYYEGIKCEVRLFGAGTLLASLGPLTDYAENTVVYSGPAALQYSNTFTICNPGMSDMRWRYRISNGTNGFGGYTDMGNMDAGGCETIRVMSDQTNFLCWEQLINPGDGLAASWVSMNCFGSGPGSGTWATNLVVTNAVPGNIWTNSVPPVPPITNAPVVPSPVPVGGELSNVLNQINVDMNSRHREEIATLNLMRNDLYGVGYKELQATMEGDQKIVEELQKVGKKIDGLGTNLIEGTGLGWPSVDTTNVSAWNLSGYGSNTVAGWLPSAQIPGAVAPSVTLPLGSLGVAGVSDATMSFGETTLASVAGPMRAFLLVVCTFAMLMWCWSILGKMGGM